MIFATKYQKIEANGTATQYIIQDGVVSMRHDMSVNSSFEENGVPFSITMINPVIVYNSAIFVA